MDIMYDSAIRYILDNMNESIEGNWNIRAVMNWEKKIPWWFELRENYQGTEVSSVEDINMRGEVN